MSSIHSDRSIAESPLSNGDLAPTEADRRTWGTYDFAALWIGLSIVTTTYTLASGLIAAGMTWWQGLLTVSLGNLIVLIPMLLNAHPGTKYGIPFPVLVRSSFGIRGANVAAMARALVACGWFGIQTWIGGAAIYAIVVTFIKNEINEQWQPPADIGRLGINWIEIACFLVFWAINMWVIYKGIESIRILLNIKAPLLITLGLVLLAWAYYAAGGFGEMIAPFFACRATRSRRARSFRRLSIHPRTRPRPLPDASCSITRRLANMRPNENWVDRITASTISVIRTMIEPVRLRKSASTLASHEPIEPPAWNDLPAISVLPNTRLRNALEHAKRRPAPVTLV